MTEAIAVTTAGSERGDEYRAVALASVAHFANHFQNMVLPPLFPLLTTQLGIGFVELGGARIAAGILGMVAAVRLLCFGTVSMRAHDRAAGAVAVSMPGVRAILTPTVLFLTGFFALLALSGTGISNFSVGALTAAFDTPLSVANVALTAYLSAQAVGVLAGGLIADRTRRHPEVAALGYD